MRCSPVLMIATVSLVLTSGVLSATTDANQIKISNVASPADSNHRLLRDNFAVDEVDTEERGGGIDKFSAKHLGKLKAYAKKLSFDLDTFEGYSSVSATNKQKYINYYNKIYRKYHPDK
ncbi:Avirulence (Avh) protein [Phytophthora megakarya]|uniref:RxLR effector protein n=1 Tax=Phytophthora megakarya TaxID=4795 RepID=A0A225UG64_9STRA|nr:Avirulence (Avh) protein [Phytophthora megakarya]